MAARYLVGATLAILVSLAGCKSAPILPEDPLFLDHKPIEAKVELKPPVHLAYVDPVMPKMPSNERGLAERSKSPQAPGIPTNAPETMPREDDIVPLPPKAPN